MSLPKINGWTCEVCEGTTYAVHVDEGVTPMFLSCRAEGLDPKEATCKGTAVSLMYPKEPPPPYVKYAVRWEWYTPDAEEYRTLKPEVRKHVDKGGVLLRHLTDAGRRALESA